MILLKIYLYLYKKINQFKNKFIIVYLFLSIMVFNNDKGGL